MFIYSSFQHVLLEIKFFMFSFHSLCSRISTQTATASSHEKSLSVSGITSLISASLENSIKISKCVDAKREMLWAQHLK